MIWATPARSSWSSEITHLVQEVAGNCFLGREVHQQLGREFWDLYTDLAKGLDPLLPPNLPLPKFIRRDRAKASLQAILEPVIVERRQHPERYDDFLQDLVNKRYPDGRLAEQELIVNLLLGLMFAGHETTAGQAAWTIILLLQNPDYLRLVQQEIQQVAPYGVHIDPRRLTQLDHIGWAVREVERMRPSVDMLMRTVEEDVEVDGYVIPRAGWPRWRRTWPITCRRCSTSPETFDPLRYAPGRAEDKQDRFALIGFGGGTHKCTGMNFANTEMTIITALLFQQFDLELVTKHPQVHRGLGASRPARPSFATAASRRASCLASRGRPWACAAPGAACSATTSWRRRTTMRTLFKPLLVGGALAAAATGLVWRQVRSRRQGERSARSRQRVPAPIWPWALVTGAARAEGLGYSFARHLAGRNFNLVLVDVAGRRAGSPGRGAADQVPGESAADCPGPGPEDFLDELLPQTADITVGLLVCNHMWTPKDTPTIMEMDLATHLAMLNINARAYTALDPRLWPARWSTRAQGGIVIVTSGAGLQTTPYTGRLFRQQSLPTRPGRSAVVRAARQRGRCAGRRARPAEHAGRRPEQLSPVDDHGRRPRGRGDAGLAEQGPSAHPRPGQQGIHVHPDPPAAAAHGPGERGALHGGGLAQAIG